MDTTWYCRCRWYRLLQVSVISVMRIFPVTVIRQSWNSTSVRRRIHRADEQLGLKCICAAGAVEVKSDELCLGGGVGNTWKRLALLQVRGGNHSGEASSSARKQRASPPLRTIAEVSSEERNDLHSTTRVPQHTSRPRKVEERHSAAAPSFLMG